MNWKRLLKRPSRCEAEKDYLNTISQLKDAFGTLLTAFCSVTESSLQMKKTIRVQEELIAHIKEMLRIAEEQIASLERADQIAQGNIETRVEMIRTLEYLIQLLRSREGHQEDGSYVAHTRFGWVRLMPQNLNLSDKPTNELPYYGFALQAWSLDDDMCMDIMQLLCTVEGIPNCTFLRLDSGKMIASLDHHQPGNEDKLLEAIANALQ